MLGKKILKLNEIPVCNRMKPLPRHACSCYIDSCLKNFHLQIFLKLKTLYTRRANQVVYYELKSLPCCNLRQIHRSKKTSKIHRYWSNNRLRKNWFIYVNRIDYIIDSLSKYWNWIASNRFIIESELFSVDILKKFLK